MRGMREYVGSALGMLLGLAFGELLMQLRWSYGAVLGWVLTVIATVAVVGGWILVNSIRRKRNRV